MEKIINHATVRQEIRNFIINEFPDFPAKLEAQFLDFFRNLSNYIEEGVKIRPRIIFTNNIDMVVKAIPDTAKIEICSDFNEFWLAHRFKNLIPFCRAGWLVYVEVRGEIVSYGIIKALNSIKDPGLVSMIFDGPYLQDKKDKVSVFFVGNMSAYTTVLKGLKGDTLNVNYSLDEKPKVNYQEEINNFSDAVFTKLKTTSKKFQTVKTMFRNIMMNSFITLHGAICVVVDKDYKDKGFLEDGIWLPEPISFSKIFMQTTTNSESRLTSMADVFRSMLEHDGITVLDNSGKIRAYNVFVENNFNTTQNVMGGSRKRAAYTIINSRRKKIIGVYFQSHDGEIFYAPCKK